MSRILLADEGHWYTELNLVSFLYETELEAKIIQHADQVFKEFFVIPFKRTLFTKKGDSSTPDLMLIRRDYSEWWLVEVEKAEHALSHVEAQIKVFRDATWNDSELTDYIIRKATDQGTILDRTLVYKLIFETKQNLMVIVDEEKEKWKPSLKKLGAKLCVFQVFFNAFSQEIYRIFGEYPYIYIASSHCGFVKGLPNLLEISHPDIIDCNHDETLELLNPHGKLTRWRRKDLGKKVYLVPVGINPLQPEKMYIVEKDTDNNYHIRLN